MHIVTIVNKNRDTTMSPDKNFEKTSSNRLELNLIDIITNSSYLSARNNLLRENTSIYVCEYQIKIYSCRNVEIDTDRMQTSLSIVAEQSHVCITCPC